MLSNTADTVFSCNGNGSKAARHNDHVLVGSHSVLTSTTPSNRIWDIGASQTATAISGTENESVEVVLSPILLNASRLFVRIQAR